jgi:hypothetical protein
MNDKESYMVCIVGVSREVLTVLASIPFLDVDISL